MPFGSCAMQVYGLRTGGTLWCGFVSWLMMKLKMRQPPLIDEVIRPSPSQVASADLAKYFRSCSRPRSEYAASG
jgi:hypothetical protein